jgi:hypothetical protein
MADFSGITCARFAPDFAGLKDANIFLAEGMTVAV